MTRSYTLGEALHRFVTNVPRHLLITRDDTHGLPTPRAIDLTDVRVTPSSTTHLQLSDLSSIRYSDIPNNGFRRVHQLSTLLDDDGIEISLPQDDFTDYVTKAYPEEFVDVELIYLDPDDDLRDDTDLMEDFLCEPTPSVTSNHENLSEAVNDTKYDGAVVEAQRICAEVDDDLQTLGFDEGDYEIGDVRDALRDADTHDYVEQYARNTGAVFVQIMLSTHDARHFSISEPELPDHLDEVTKTAVTRMWAISTLSTRGIEPTDHNVAMFLNALDEVTAYPYLELTIFGRVDLAAFVDKTYDQTLVEIDRPYLWVGDTHEGYGIETERLDGSLLVPTGNVHHHRHAGGHSLVEINGFNEGAFDVLDVTFHVPRDPDDAVVTDED